MESSTPSNTTAPVPTSEEYASLGKSRRPTTAVSNNELYDRWASVYDTDGNILQAIDDQELPNLLTPFFSLLPPSARITELGCGTGRNTLKLLQPPFSSQINGLICLDLSEKMLAIAQQRISSNSASVPVAAAPELVFGRFDVLSDPIPEDALGADGVVSTLVLEHLPLDVFFSTSKKMLKPGGIFLLTNMHAEMGGISRAGFLDSEKGVKVQGTSFVYEISEVLEEAHRQGFALVGTMRERRVEEEDLESIGGRGRKWLGVKVWFGGVFQLEN